MAVGGEGRRGEARRVDIESLLHTGEKLANTCFLSSFRGEVFSSFSFNSIHTFRVAEQGISPIHDWMHNLWNYVSFPWPTVICHPSQPFSSYRQWPYIVTFLQRISFEFSMLCDQPDLSSLIYLCRLILRRFRHKEIRAYPGLVVAATALAPEPHPGYLLWESPFSYLRRMMAIILSLMLRLGQCQDGRWRYVEEVQRKSCPLVPSERRRVSRDCVVGLMIYRYNNTRSKDLAKHWGLTRRLWYDDGLETSNIYLCHLFRPFIWSEMTRIRATWIWYDRLSMFIEPWMTIEVLTSMSIQSTVAENRNIPICMQLHNHARHLDSQQSIKAAALVVS